jgi:hypothetical protein
MLNRWEPLLLLGKPAVLEILQHGHDHKSDACSKTEGKTKFTSAERWVCLWPKSGKPAHTWWRKDPSVLIPDAVLPLALTRELGFTVFIIDWGWGLGEGIEEEQTWLESTDTTFNLIGVSKDKEMTHKMGISRILGKLRPEMTVEPEVSAPSI